MGFLNKLFGTGEEAPQQPQQTPAPAPQEPAQVAEVPQAGRQLNLTKGQTLNLQKNDTLNLTKSEYSLSRLRAAAGWDVNDSLFGSNYDLDLCAYLQDANGVVKQTVFFGSKGNLNKYGVQLDHDNLTGDGEGDDENIFLNLDAVPADIAKITIAVVIYQAKSRRQHFGKVKNAYIRLLDESDNDREMFRFNLSNNGEGKHSVIAADIYRDASGWNFFAREEYSDAGAISELERKL